MTAGAYSVTNTFTGRVYVGSSVDVDKRWRGHLSSFRSNRQPRLMQHEWEAYGDAAFIFALLEETASDEMSLQASEQRWLNSFDAERLYNRGRRVSRPYRVLKEKGGLGEIPAAQAFACILQSKQQADETDAEFARRLGISRAHWSRIRIGTRAISVDLARTIIRLWPDLMNPYIEAVRQEVHSWALDDGAA